MELEFNYDISCPWAYIASARIEALAARTGANLIWRAVHLGAIFRATKTPQGAAGSATDIINKTKTDVVINGFYRTLKRHGIAYNQPPRHPPRSVDALRLIYYIAPQHRPALSKALFKAYWVDGRDIADRALLLELARDVGFRGAGDLTEAAFSDENAKRELEKATADAVERGAPGVPAFWIPDEEWQDCESASRKGRLYWGQDRMHFVEASLLRLTGRPAVLKELIPRCIRSNQAHGQVKVEFWFDFSSPWAFLGWTQLDRMKRMFGDSLEIVLKPLLLGALFKEIGTPMVPMAAVSEQRRMYMKQDHADWVRFWNSVNEQEGSPDKLIEFQWAEVFPIRTPALLRCAIADPNCIPLLYRSCWELNANVSDESVLKDVLDKGGFPGAALLERTKIPEVKERLFAHTGEAKAAGICGAPSYRVFCRQPGGDWAQVGGVVWGQDELAVVEDLICGWEESLGDVANVDKQSTGAPSSRL